MNYFQKTRQRAVTKSRYYIIAYIIFESICYLLSHIIFLMRITKVKKSHFSIIFGILWFLCCCISPQSCIWFWFYINIVVVLTLLKERYKKGQKWREDEEEEVSNYWTILRKREDIGIWKKKHVENSLWKRLWTYFKTDHGINGSYISVLTRIKSSYTHMN